MKILLIGEFSGVHNNLKKGLTEVGHDVKLAADGDGYKGFSYDIAITPYKSKYFGKLLNILYFFTNLRRYINNDVVQFISPFALPYYFYYLGFYRIIFLLNKKTIYYACGTDPAYLSSADKLDYFPYEKNSPEWPNFQKKNKNVIFNWFINKVDSIIPSMYEYFLGYSHLHKTQRPIPLPCSGQFSEINKYPYAKLRILFGISRREFKGARYIIDAIDKLRSIHKDDLEINIIERLPFYEYLSLIENSDILIDQCKSYSYGMNALFAMEKGKIVLSGSEDVAMKYIGIENSAVINLKPDSNQIYNELVKLLTMTNSQILLLKKENQNQAINHHDPSIIAKSFLNIYRKLLVM